MLPGADEQPEFGDNFHDFIPDFMVTPGAHACKDELDEYLRTRVVTAYAEVGSG